MTSELKEQFFKVFGIEQKNNGCEEYFYMPDAESCKECEDKPCLKHLTYPDITAEKLLEMICILNETSCEVLESENKEDLKNEILETCIKVYNTPIITSDGDEYDNYAIYEKIQQLFKEEE